MRHTILALAGAALLIVGGASPRASDASELFTSTLRGNVANQVIAGFASSTATWDIERGRVSIVPVGGDAALVLVRTKGLIIPALGFNPSPDLLARIVCHDAAGTPSEAARTRTVPFPPSGDAHLQDVVVASRRVLRADRAPHRLHRSAGGEPGEVLRGDGLLIGRVADSRRSWRSHRRSPPIPFLQDSDLD